MKIIVAGDWHSKIHESSVFFALKQLGCEVEKFSWCHYFFANNSLTRFYKKVQNKVLWGPVINKINRDLLLKISSFSPDLIFVYRGTHISESTLKKIKLNHPNIKIVGYNNDDPFSKEYGCFLWRIFLKAVPFYDLILAYRQHNIEQYLKIGARRVEMMRSWYDPYLHKKVSISKNDRDKYFSDCIFVGHFEDDGRDSFIEGLLDHGLSVRIFGPFSGFGKYGWEKAVMKSPVLKKLLPIGYLDSESYVKAINSNSIGLCFLSKLNKDTYTRRCFEIPAMGAALFSEYTDDLANLFKDGEEAVFFRSKEELISKVLYYKKHPRLLNEIRRNGMLRVKNDGHDVISRMKSFLEMAKAI